MFYVCFYFYFLFFSLRAAVSAVFQPCRTCFNCSSRTLLLHLCSWRINDGDDIDHICIARRWATCWQAAGIGTTVASTCKSAICQARNTTKMYTATSQNRKSLDAMNATYFSEVKKVGGNQETTQVVNHSQCYSNTQVRTVVLVKYLTSFCTNINSDTLCFYCTWWNCLVIR